MSLVALLKLNQLDLFIKPAEMSKPICEFFANELEISKERIYIFFQNVDPQMWAWNSKTFG